MTPLPQTNAVVRELGRLAFRLGLLAGGMPDWTALAGACGVSAASLFAVMTQGGSVSTTWACGSRSSCTRASRRAGRGTLP
jgi:hypothetical protein